MSTPGFPRTRATSGLAATMVLGFVLGSQSAAFAQDHHAHEVPPAEHSEHTDHSDHEDHAAHSEHAEHADHSAHSDHVGHAAHEHAEHHAAPSNSAPELPPITDADRAAAFPDLGGHAAHDRAVHAFLMLDQFEWQNADHADLLKWDINGWIGGDVNRIWFRAEGEREGGKTEESDLQVLYGRMIARWWDLVAGVRQDFQPGPSQTWVAIGLQGLAPYWFEIEATAFVGEGGQTAARLEAAYELLLTNRLILQPLIELDVYGKDDQRRGIGAGLSSAQAGLRLRYEIRREFAPYIGFTWRRLFGETADFARLAGEESSDTRVVAGLRVWF